MVVSVSESFVDFLKFEESGGHDSKVFFSVLMSKVIAELGNRGLVRLRCFFFAVEVAKVFQFPVRPHSRTPILSCFVPIDSDESGGRSCLLLFVAVIP